MFKIVNGNYVTMTQEDIEKSKEQDKQEPEKPLSDIDILKQQVTDLQLAMTEIYEEGILNG